MPRSSEFHRDDIGYRSGGNTPESRQAHFFPGFVGHTGHNTPYDMSAMPEGPIFSSSPPYIPPETSMDRDPPSLYGQPAYLQQHHDHSRQSLDFDSEYNFWDPSRGPTAAEIQRTAEAQETAWATQETRPEIRLKSEYHLTGTIPQDTLQDIKIEFMKGLSVPFLRYLKDEIDRVNRQYYYTPDGLGDRSFSCMRNACDSLISYHLNSDIDENQAAEQASILRNEFNKEEFGQLVHFDQRLNQDRATINDTYESNMDNHFRALRNQRASKFVEYIYSTNPYAIGDVKAYAESKVKDGSHWHRQLVDACTHINLIHDNLPDEGQITTWSDENEAFQGAKSFTDLINSLRTIPPRLHQEIGTFKMLYRQAGLE